MLDISESRHESSRKYRFSFTRVGTLTLVDMHRVHHGDYVGEVLIRIGLGPFEDRPDFLGPTGAELVSRIADALRIFPQQVTLHRPSLWAEARRPGLANAFAMQVPTEATVPIGLPRYIEVVGEFLQTTALLVPSDATVDLVRIAAEAADSYRPPRTPLPGLGPVPAVLSLSVRKQVVFLDHPALSMPLQIVAGATACMPSLYEPAHAMPAAAPPPARRRMRPLGYYLNLVEIHDILDGVRWSSTQMQRYVEYLSQFTVGRQEAGLRFHIAHPGLADSMANHPTALRLRRDLPMIPTAHRPDCCLVPLQLLDWPWALLYLFHKNGRLHTWLLGPSDHLTEMAASPPMAAVLRTLQVQITRLIHLGKMLAPADHTLIAMVALTQITTDTAIGSSPWSRSVFLQRAIHMATQLCYTPVRLLSTEGDIVMTHVVEPATPSFHLVALTMSAHRPGLCSCWFPFSKAKVHMPDVHYEPLPMVDTHAVGTIPFAAMADYTDPARTQHEPNSLERFRVMPPRGVHPDPFLETPTWPSLRTYRFALRALNDPQVIRMAFAALRQATTPPTVCMGLLGGHEVREWWDTWVWVPCFEVWLDVLAATQSVYATEIYGPAQKFRITKHARESYRPHIQHVALSRWRARHRRLAKAFQIWRRQHTGAMTRIQLASLAPTASAPHWSTQQELLERIIEFLPQVPPASGDDSPLELEPRIGGLEFNGVLERSEATSESEAEGWATADRIPEID